MQYDLDCTAIVIEHARLTYVPWAGLVAYLTAPERDGLDLVLLPVHPSAFLGRHHLYQTVYLDSVVELAHLCKQTHELLEATHEKI